MLMFPKPVKPLKHRKPIKRSSKPIAKKSVFKEHGANETKTYRRRYTDYQVLCQAEVSRQARLRNATEAEEAMAAILTRLGVTFVREAIVQNGDRWVLLDFLIPSVRLALELDGSAHRGQERYDAGRSMWLGRKHGLHVVRFQNRDVFSGLAQERVMQMLRLGDAK